MYLKRLEIQGFKSFANRTVLDFIPAKNGALGITTIVGPNGSGKSNIAEAIRWAMGEQSLKLLRGKKNEDMIFNGSETKSRLGMAEVNLILNNSEGKVCKEYPEIVITRRIYRSGESECLINNNSARLFDIRLVLAQLQCAGNSYGIIGQGMIDQMLIAGSAERKEFLDEAAGIKEFQIKRHQAGLKLNRTLQNIIQAERLIQEVEPRLKLLSRQVKKLEKRQVVEMELREAQEKYFNSIYHRNKKEMDQIISSLSTVENKHDKVRRELDKIQKELSRLARAAGRQEVFAELQDNYQAAQQDKNELARRLSILEGQMHTEYSKRGQQNIGWLENKINELKFQADKIIGQRRTIEGAADKISDEIIRQRKKIDKLLSEKSEKMVRISRWQSQLLEGQSEQNFLQLSGLSTVKAVLEAERSLGKIYGVLSNLGKAEEEYRLALDIAAGSCLSSIVVKDEDVARKAISYLREKKMGVATFMPLNKITGKEPCPEIENLKDDEDVIGLAIDLLKFESKFKDIFSFILGNTLVVRNLQAAKRIGIGRIRMVTLDGDLIEKAGLMKGGYRQFKKNSLSFSSKISLSAEDRLKECQMQLALEQQGLSEIERDIEAAKKVLSGSEAQLQIKRAKSAILDEETQKIDKEKSALERDLSLLKLTPEEHGEHLVKLADEKDKIIKETEKAEKRLLTFTQQISEFNENEEKKKQRVFDLQEDMRIKQEELNRFTTERNDWRISLAKIETKQETLDEEVNIDLNVSLMSIVERKLEIVSPSQLEELAARLQKLKYQLSLIGSIDDEVVQEHEQTKERYDFLFNQLNDLKTATKDLEKMIGNLDELMKTKRAAAFKRIRKEFNRYFKILFEGGTANLEEIYAEEKTEEEITEDVEGEVSAEDKSVLAPEKLRPGKKEKILVGIEVLANPPGKKIKNINALSGGERTLTAIALICAVLNYNPSPFVVLDEVEASLDEANTLRFTKILSELANKSQFIIITHNRVTMHASDALYGVTMGIDGVSKLLSVKMEDVPQYMEKPPIDKQKKM